MTKLSDKPNKLNIKEFRILLVLIMLTWVILGIEVMGSVFVGENTAYLSDENQAQYRLISSMKVRDEVLEKKIEIVNTNISLLTKEIDMLMQNYMSPSSPDRFKGKVGSASEDNKNTNTATTKIAKPNDKEAKAQSIDIKKRSFEYMSFDREALTEGLSEVSDRTASLEAKVFEVSEALQNSKSLEKANSLILATVRLRDAIKSTQSFSEELLMFKTFSGNDESLKEHILILEKYAGDGIESHMSLAEEFNNIANELINISRKNKVNPDLLDKLAMQFSNLVQIKKMKAHASDNSTEDIIARTYNYLLAYDLENAVKEVSKLSGDEKIIVHGWLEKAAAAIASDVASEEIFKYVTSPSYAKIN